MEKILTQWVDLLFASPAKNAEIQAKITGKHRRDDNLKTYSNYMIQRVLL